MDMNQTALMEKSSRAELKTERRKRNSFPAAISALLPFYCTTCRQKSINSYNTNTKLSRASEEDKDLPGHSHPIWSQISITYQPISWKESYMYLKQNVRYGQSKNIGHLLQAIKLMPIKLRWFKFHRPLPVKTFKFYHKCCLVLGWSITTPILIFIILILHL